MFLADDSSDDRPPVPAAPATPATVTTGRRPAAPQRRSVVRRGIDGQAERVLERLLDLERRAVAGDPLDADAIAQAELDLQDLQLAIRGAAHGWEHPADRLALRDAGRSIALAAAVTVDLVERLARG